MSLPVAETDLSRVVAKDFEPIKQPEDIKVGVNRVESVRYHITEARLDSILAHIEEALKNEVPYNRDQLAMACAVIDLLNLKLRTIKTIIKDVMRGPQDYARRT